MSILRCKYIFYGIYELPGNIHSLEDLNNNTNIDSWYIKWSVLNINWKDGTTTEIESAVPIDATNDCKYPSDKPEDYIFEDNECV